LFIDRLFLQIDMQVITHKILPNPHQRVHSVA